MPHVVVARNSRGKDLQSETVMIKVYGPQGGADVMPLPADLDESNVVMATLTVFSRTCEHNSDDEFRDASTTKL